MSRPDTGAAPVRIGCGAGFWGDSPEGPSQLVRSGGIDFLVLDYLAEITLSILARMRSRRPDAGHATDFASLVIRPLAAELAERRIRVVSNAGGVNPLACRAALEAACREAGVDLKIAVVTGDDLADSADRYRAAGVTEMFSGAPMPASFTSVNAYLGAFPIARALDEGADIVVTGRIVDSALVLGPLVHAFGWRPSDLDRLSAGSLAGHLLECGAQVTGGLFTDWKRVPGWDRMGFPIAICSADGSFEVTKPEGTGGLVEPATVAEQLVYEVGDPGAYPLPDVCCDWRQVRIESIGADRVRVTGARGMPPPDTCKVSATWADGFRSLVTLMVAGHDAADRARATGEAIVARSRRLMRNAGFDDFTETSIEVIGSESSYGAQARAPAREVILKIAVRHPDSDALRIFGREVYPAATSMAQGITGLTAGRPEPTPLIRLFSFTAPWSDIRPEVWIDSRRIAIERQAPSPAARSDPGRSKTEPSSTEDPSSGRSPTARVPLIAVAHGRSGDKGDIANIGVIARHPDFVAPIRASLTAERVRDYFRHYVRGAVERHEWPGIDGFNFVMHGALGGGGIASLRYDPQGKALAQILMDIDVDVPADWLAPGGRLAATRR